MTRRRYSPDFADTPTESAYVETELDRAEDEADDNAKDAADMASVPASGWVDGEITRAFRAVFGPADQPKQHAQETPMSDTKPDRAGRNHGLKFYPGNHRYRLDGDWVPGVTTILGVLDKPAIPKWAAKSVAQYVANNREGIEHLWNMGERAVVDALKGIPWEQRDKAGVRGTDVHDFAERILNGESVDVPDEYVGHVESCLAFMEDWDIKPILVEATVGSREHTYAGKLDLIADSKHAPRAIFDWKTAASGIYKETAFQLVAYAFAEFYGEDGDEKPLADLGVEESFGVHVRADGYDVFPLAFGPDVYEEFLTIRRAFDINKRANGNWKVPGSGYVGVASRLHLDLASRLHIDASGGAA